MDLQKSGDSADDEEGKQQLNSPTQSPNKTINNMSDHKVDVFALNDCVNCSEDIKDKESNITFELSRQQSTNKQEFSDFVSSKSPPQVNVINEEINQLQIERLQSITQQLSRQKSELNNNKFQEQDSSSQESDVSGNDTSSDSSDDEKIKKKQKRQKEIRKEKEKEKDDRQQHHIPKKLLGMLKEFGINERVLIVFHELIIGQIIGEGGYGVVHKGKWLGQDVAIKSYDTIRNKEQHYFSFDHFPIINMIVIQPLINNNNQKLIYNQQNSQNLTIIHSLTVKENHREIQSISYKWQTFQKKLKSYQIFVILIQFYIWEFVFQSKNLLLKKLINLLKNKQLKLTILNIYYILNKKLRDYHFNQISNKIFYLKEIIQFTENRVMIIDLT